MNETCEIFPKQNELKPSDNGNFINLPYHRGNTRVLINHECKQLKFDEAMLYASKRVTNESNWSKFKLLDHEKSTGRNDRTFAAAGFIKKHNEYDWEEQVVKYNKIFNNPPLEEKELF